MTLDELIKLPWTHKATDTNGDKFAYFGDRFPELIWMISTEELEVLDVPKKYKRVAKEELEWRRQNDL